MMGTKAAQKSEQKDYSGRLPFRTSAETHQRIAEAAQRQNCKSINAWMEKVLSEAANDALGLDSLGSDSTSPQIMRLLNDTDEETAQWAGQLIAELSQHLEKNDPMTIIRFNSALKKLLIGMDAMRSQLGSLGGKEISTSLSKLCPHPTADGILVSIFGMLLDHGDQLDIRQLNNAIKRLMIGVQAIYPMVKQDNRATRIGQIFEQVEVALQQAETL